MKADGVIAYQETVQHPAFNEDIINTGVLFVAAKGAPTRRQMQPEFEELEIGPDFIVVRRNDKSVRHPIPGRQAGFLSVLRSVILGTPEKIDRRFSKRLEVTAAGWTATLTSTSGRHQTIALSGCGKRLKSIRIRTKNGQTRHLRFLPG